MKIKNRGPVLLTAIVIFTIISCDSGLWDLNVIRDSPYDLQNTDGYIQAEVKEDSVLASASFVSMTVSWEIPADVVSYESCQLWYGLNGTADTQFTGTIAPSGTEITGLQNGEEYTVVIKTVDTAGNISEGISFTVTTTAGTLPKGLGPEDLEFREDSVSGDGISADEHINTKTVYLAVNTGGHTDNEDFTLHYRINGYQEDWQTLNGGNTLITGLPDGPYSLDVEYLHNDEPDFQTDSVTPMAFNINTEDPATASVVKAFAGYEAAGIRWNIPKDWDYDHVVVSTSPADAADVNIISENYCEITGLTNDTDYTFSINVVDKYGHESTAAISATPGELVTYGQDFFNSETFSIIDIVEDSTGRIFAAGYINSGTASDGMLLAFTENLTPDFSIFDESILTVDYENGDLFYACDIDSQGRIVLAGRAGWVSNTSSLNDMLVVRLNSDGSVDTHFGNSGFLRLGNDIASTGIEIAYNVCVNQSDDSIWVGGGVQQSTSYSADPGVYSLDSTGSLNTLWDSDGFWYEEDHCVGYYYPTTGYARDSAETCYNIIADDGYIYLTGNTYNEFQSKDYDIWLMKKNPDGTTASGWTHPVLLPTNIAGGGEDESLWPRCNRDRRYCNICRGPQP